MASLFTKKPSFASLNRNTPKIPESARRWVALAVFGMIFLWNYNIVVSAAFGESQPPWDYRNSVVENRLSKISNFVSQVCELYSTSMPLHDYKRLARQGKVTIQYTDWLALKRPNHRFMFVAPKEQFMYCKALKNGSTNWTYYLLKLAGLPDSLINTDIGIHKYLREFYPEIHDGQLVKKNFKFMISRHPFERLLSAYRDKLENYERDIKFRKGYYYNNFGKHIVQNFRNEKFHLNRTEPTWREFVLYILKTSISNYDYHWKPMYTMCSPCATKFDAIADMDTFTEDTQYIIHKIGLENKLRVKWIHKTGEKPTSDVARQYFGELTQNQVERLYRKFKIDFDLFGYSYLGYKEMAKKTNATISSKGEPES